MPLGDAESLLHLRPARSHENDNESHCRVFGFQLEILKFYIRITSAS
jgi:hypothetical protein